MGSLSDESTDLNLWDVIREQQLLLNEQAMLFAEIQKRVDAIQAVASREVKNRHDSQINSTTSEVDEFPYIATIVLLTGCTCLMTFFVREYHSYYFLTKSPHGLHQSVSIGEFLQYRLDFYFSSTRLAKPLLLLSLVFIIILQSTIALMVLQGDDVAKSIWTAWTQLADPGTHADAVGTIDKIVGFVTTIGGMLVFALMIGVITDTIGQKLEDFKKGKAKAIESNHTLILGWSQKGIAILRQLALANKSLGGRPVVVLCDQPKEYMEECLRTAVNSKHDPLELFGTRVVFRCGNPLAELDLVKVSAASARAIIALSPDGLPADAADSRMVRQVLSLQQIKNLFGFFKGFTVVELQDIDNKALVQIAGKGDVEIIVSRDLIGRLMLLSSRSPWISVVLDDLMGFEGSEFYSKEWPQLVGSTFGSIRFRFDKAVPVGVKLSDGRIVLNPPENYRLVAGDSVLALAEDEDSYSPNDRECQQYHGFFKLRELQDLDKDNDTEPEKMLFCGWRRDMADMISELDYDVPADSELWLFNNVPIEDRAARLLDKGNKSQLKLRNIKLKHAVGNPIIRRELLSLAEVSDGHSPCEDGTVLEAGERTGRREVLNFFSSISILSCYGEEAETRWGRTLRRVEVGSETADNRSIATTLMIRDIQYKSLERLRILGLPSDFSPTISEIIEPGTRALMQFTADLNYQGFVMSSNLVASALAMVSECRDMNKIFGELLSCQGNQIRIRKARDFVNEGLGEALSFWDLSCLAKMSHEVLIGYIPFSSFGAEQGQEGADAAVAAADRSWAAQQQSPPGQASPGGFGSLGGTQGETICVRGRRSSSVAGRQPLIVLNPPDKGVPRLWHPQDRLIVIGMCRQAKHKAALRAQRRLAEERLKAKFSGGGVAIHGWLRKLNSGKENEMEDEGNWRDRLCFVMEGRFAYASEKKEGETEDVCLLDDIRGIQAGNGWPPGFNTFKIDLRGAKKAVIFSAPTPAECLCWMNALSRTPAGAAPSATDTAAAAAAATVGRSNSPSGGGSRRTPNGTATERRATRQSTLKWPKI